jgi:hypothetical protein
MKELSHGFSVSHLSSPELRCLPDAVVVDRMVVHDPMVVEYYSGMPEERRADSAQDAFIIGTRALSAAGGSATMASLNDHLQSAVRAAAQNLAALPGVMSTQIDSVCRQYLGEEGRFATYLDKDLQSLGAALAADGPIVEQMRCALSADLRQRLTDALAPLTQALNVNDANGPLGLIQRSLQDVISGQVELRELINGVIRTQAARDRSVHKGYDLEDFVELCLGELTSQLGDQLENCSRTAGFIPGCKAGDFFTHVDERLTAGVDVRVVLEAKNRKNDSVAALCAALDSALENRDALVGIGVLTDTKSARPIALYGMNKIIVHFAGFGTPDADLEYQSMLLRLAYYVARVQVVALAKSSSNETVDTAYVMAHLERLNAAIAQFRTLGRNLGAIETAVRKTRDTAEGIRDEIAAIVEDLTAALNPSLRALGKATLPELAVGHSLRAQSAGRS